MLSQNKSIIGFLYFDEAGYVCITNDGSHHRILVEDEDRLLKKANCLTTSIARDIRWKNTDDVETWDVGILSDLEHDLQSDGQDPQEELSYENEPYSTIIISAS
ncbi:MAG TPA: hypothetical protein EYQ00_05245 [Dehalococcoidia bacterium]|jgi:hypothetical protein|nr:hypothetical protein [Dehalococcoidia bacterium]